MIAIWNADRTANMTREDNLLNLCRQFEQQYVDWARACHDAGTGYRVQWPAIGELGRYHVAGVEVEFLTTAQRQVLVIDASGQKQGIVPIRPGMADQLYRTALAVVLAQGGGEADRLRPAS